MYGNYLSYLQVASASYIQSIKEIAPLSPATMSMGGRCWPWSQALSHQPPSITQILHLVVHKGALSAKYEVAGYLMLFVCFVSLYLLKFSQTTFAAEVLRIWAICVGKSD